MGPILKNCSVKEHPMQKMQGKEKDADVPGQEILEHTVGRVADMDAFIAMRDN